jgi:hypothetical protein
MQAVQQMNIAARTRVLIERVEFVSCIRVTQVQNFAGVARPGQQVCANE